MACALLFLASRSPRAPGLVVQGTVLCRCALGERGVPSRARAPALSARKEGPSPPPFSRSAGVKRHRTCAGPPICGNAPARELPTIRHGCWLAVHAGCRVQHRYPSDPPPASRSWSVGRSGGHWWGTSARYINNGLYPTSDSEPSRTRTGSDAFSALREQRAQYSRVGEFERSKLGKLPPGIISPGAPVGSSNPG